jgi:hypothetical protein
MERGPEVAGELVDERFQTCFVDHRSPRLLGWTGARA